MKSELLPILLVVVPLTASAALSDLRTGLIPNRLVLIGLCAGCVVRAMAFAAAMPEASMSLGRVVASSGIGLCVCGAAPYLLFRRGAMGGGDVKLLGAVGAAAGPALGVRIEMLAFILGAVYVLARLALARRGGALLSSSLALVLRPFSSAARRAASADEDFGALRFGPAIFAATLLVAAECWGRS
jgi:Flp pilus assembly protein protease CpaA